MATFTPTQFSGRLLALELTVDRVATEGITTASQVVRVAILSHTPARLSGVGKRGAKLGVKVTLQPIGNGAKATVSATGPFQLIERDTQPHRIPRSHARGGPKHYVVIPGQGVYANAEHPGTTGKHPFERGVRESAPLVEKVFDVRTNVATRSVL